MMEEPVQPFCTQWTESTGRRRVAESAEGAADNQAGINPPTDKLKLFHFRFSFAFDALCGAEFESAKL